MVLVSLVSMKKNLKIGLKINDIVSADYVKKISGEIDFLEIYAEPGSEFEVLSSFTKPVVVHVAHFDSGVNFANPKRKRANEIALSHAVSLANKFKSSRIIFHPELKEDESCTLGVLEDFISSHYDERLHIESMPFSSMGYEHFAANPSEIKHLLKTLSVKFCLDLAHTIEYLAHTKLPNSAVEDYLALKPNHFHITDADISGVFDKNYNERHLNFGDGTMDLDWFKRVLPDNSWVTIETPTDIERQVDEVRYLRQAD